MTCVTRCKRSGKSVWRWKCKSGWSSNGSSYRRTWPPSCQWPRGTTDLGHRKPVWLQNEIPQKSTTSHNLRPEGADCAVCSHNWRANSCAFLCNMFYLHHAQSSRRYFDRKYFNRRMRFLFAKLALCVPPFCCEYIYPHCTAAKWQNGGTHNASLANKKRILRLKYLQSKYRLELWAWCKSNILHRNAQLFAREFCEHTAQSAPSGRKLWQVVDFCEILSWSQTHRNQAILYYMQCRRHCTPDYDVS